MIFCITCFSLQHTQRCQESAIDATKIKTELGWQPSVTVEEGLRQTVKWFLNNRDWWEPLLSEEYQAYYKQVYSSS